MRERGALVDIGGRRLRAVRAGGGDGPLVFLEAGAFGFSADWAVVQRRLAERGFASLAYDRAGLGRSDPGPTPRDGEAIGSDAEALIAREAADGPLILCGHSMAGLHMHRLAVRLRHRVRGLVLVDATTPQSMQSRLVSLAIGQFAGVSRLAAWGAGAGLLKPLAGTGLADRIGLDGATAEEKRWAFAAASHNAVAAEEVAAWGDAARQALEAGALDPALPVAVVLAGGPEVNAGLKALQTAPAEASRHGLVLHVPEANHASMLAGPHAEIIVRAIEHVAACGAVEAA